MLRQATREELTQRALDYGAQGAMASGEPLVVGAEKLLDVLADQSEQGGFAWPSRSVNSGTDLHTDIRAGGREPGGCASG